MKKNHWHTAGSRGPRQTFGFVIPDKDLWESMVEDISTINVV